MCYKLERWPWYEMSGSGERGDPWERRPGPPGLTRYASEVEPFLPTAGPLNKFSVLILFIIGS